MIMFSKFVSKLSNSGVCIQFLLKTTQQSCINILYCYDMSGGWIVKYHKKLMTN